MIEKKNFMFHFLNNKTKKKLSQKIFIDKIKKKHFKKNQWEKYEKKIEKKILIEN